MKRLALILFLFIILTGCGSSFDEEGYKLAEGYYSEIVPIVNEAYIHISGMDPKKIDAEIEEHAKKIRSVNEEYWENDILGGVYEDGEIEGWLVKKSRGNGEEWVVDGKELLDALLYMNIHSNYLANDIDKALNNPTEEHIYNLAESVLLTQETAAELRKIISNQ